MFTKKTTSRPNSPFQNFASNDGVKRVVTAYTKSPIRAWGITATIVVVIVQLVLAFGSTATGLAENYKNSVNSVNVNALNDQNLFPHGSATNELPAFLANSYTPFTISRYEIDVAEVGDTATIAFQTEEGTTFEIAASKNEYWFGPLWVSQWQVDTSSPTIRVSVDPALPENLDFTFGDMPFTSNDIASMTTVDSNYAVLPGVLTYSEPQFGFLSGGTQVNVYTSGAQRLTLGPDGETMNGDLVISAEKKFKKSVVKCSKKKRCNSLPKYKNTEFKVKKPAGSWDNLSTFDKYKVNDCVVKSTTFESSVAAKIEFECAAKVTRTFLWSDTFEQGFVWGWWYYYWYVTTYDSRKDSLHLTVSGDASITFDPVRETFTPKLVSFDGVKQ
jgi:hypothetical protein